MAGPPGSAAGGEQEVKAFVAKAPQREAEAREILKTAPEVGPVTAEVILSELGDISRFRNAKTVCAYAGLNSLRSPDLRDFDVGPNLGSRPRQRSSRRVSTRSPDR